MKKKKRMSARLVLRIAIVALVLLAVAGIVLLIVDESTSTTMTIYGIIAFSVSLVSVALAVVSQIDVARSDRLIDKLTREMAEMEKDNRSEIRSDTKNKEKLDEILHVVEGLKKK